MCVVSVVLPMHQVKPKYKYNSNSNATIRKGERYTGILNATRRDKTDRKIFGSYTRLFITVHLCQRLAQNPPQKKQQQQQQQQPKQLMSCCAFLF